VQAKETTTIMTWTQLHDAAEHDDVKNVIALSRLHSEDAFKADDHGFTPLHIMCWGIPTQKALKLYSTLALKQ